MREHETACPPTAVPAEGMAVKLARNHAFRATFTRRVAPCGRGVSNNNSVSPVLSTQVPEAAPRIFQKQPKLTNKWPQINQHFMSRHRQHSRTVIAYADGRLVKPSRCVYL
jgi:hypothetical protein